MNTAVRCRVLVTQVRHKHDSLLPAGAGGRSSFSGQAATVFGGTGFIGHSLVNNLGRIGSSVTLPVRGSVERTQVQDMRIMGDLGALQFVPEFDIERWTDQQVMDVIGHSNVVYNVIGDYRSTNHFPRRMTNVEWPERLARLVAEKDDGTRLVHLVHLNCENELQQAKSGILREEAEAIERMRAHYPDAIIVKAATAVGWKDHFSHWWCTDGEMWQRSISYIGAFPLMYGGGANTFVAPIRKMDLCRAMAVIGSHPDSDGHDFELFNDQCFKLSELVEFMYDVKWQNMKSLRIPHMRGVGMNAKKDVDLDLFQWDVLGDLDAEAGELTLGQRMRRKMLKLHLAKLNWPRFIYGPLRFMDYIKREQSLYYDWTNEDHFNLMNMSELPSFQNPGFKELGVTPHEILPSVHETCASYLPGNVDIFKAFHQFDKPPVYNVRDVSTPSGKSEALTLKKLEA